MKKLLIFISFGFNVVYCQNISQEKDSLFKPKHEVGLNIIPIISLFGGSIPYHNVRFSLNYRLLFKEKNILRVSVSTFPFKDYHTSGQNGNVFFAGTSDTNLIYRNPQYKNSLKLQLNIGYERILNKQKIKHSLGVDLFVNSQHKRIEERYYWIGKSIPIETTSSVFELVNNKIDTMGHVTTSDIVGIGAHLFYNLRIPLSKHWLISTTVGPYFTYSIVRDKVTRRKNGEVENNTYNVFDFDSVLVTDISICYRF